MGLSHKSHGSKSDKETQSPMLKIFKDIMQKEKTDPEKINLLMHAKNKLKEKRRKSYSGSRSKTDNRSYDSSSTDRYNRSSNQAKITVQSIQESKRENASHDPSSSVFPDARRESWWFWKDNKFTSKNKSDDTCSCVSCALKRICSSEYTCVACLLILFSVSVAVAFLLVFKTLPSTDEVTEKNTLVDNLKKFRMMKEKRQLTESYGYGYTEKSKWDDSLMNPVGSYPNLLGSEYTGRSYKGSNIMDDLETGMSEDLASVLDNDKVVEGQNNLKLKEFFKKLIQTDAQIRKLKQAINSNNHFDNLKTITDRFKRSIKKVKGKHRFRFKNKTTVHTKASTNKETVATRKEDEKRSITADDLAVSGYVIESKEVVLQYDPYKKRNFPKCSHTHEEKSHEKTLKHPYYKHSQRVDEMLDNYKKPYPTSDNFDVIYDVTENFKISKPDNDREDSKTINELVTKTAKTHFDDKNDHKSSLIRAKTESNEPENRLMSANEYERQTEGNTEYRRFNDKNDVLNHRHHYLTTTTRKTTTMVKDVNDGDPISDTSDDFDYDMEKLLSTTPLPLYDLALSVSTFLNPMDRAVLRQKFARNQHLGQRKLLQVDEEDEDQEELGYEDLNEVLNDDKEGHDDLDGHGERKKRDDAEKAGIPDDFNQNKHIPLNVINPNWKGPMPLYPDELNAMIRRAALQNLYNMHELTIKRDTKVKRDIVDDSTTGLECPSCREEPVRNSAVALFKIVYNEKTSALSDTQYVEDYSDKKNNKLAKLAQAYSDYGVLYKNENMNFKDKGKKPAYIARFHKLFDKQKPFERYGKGTTHSSEGFKFEIRPGNAPNNEDFITDLHKFVKFGEKLHDTHRNTIFPKNDKNFEYDKLLTPTHLLEIPVDLSTTPASPTKPDHCLILNNKKGGLQRTLKSIDMTYEDEDNIDEAIALNLNEFNNTINALIDLNKTDEINDIINQDSSENLNGVYVAINDTDIRNVNEDSNTVNETVMKNNNFIIKPTEISSNVIRDKIYGKDALDLTNKRIIHKNTSNFKIRKSLRTLKSLGIIQEANDDGQKENSKLNKVSKTNKEITVITENIIFNHTNEVNQTLKYENNLLALTNNNITNKTKNNLNNTADGIISFISMMSDWFHTIATLSGEINNEEFNKESNAYNNSKSNVTIPKSKKKSLEENITRDILYPSYDVEMVDNIGHRSRVLLSYDDNSTVKDVMKTTIPESKDIDEVLPIALVIASNDTEKTKTTNKTIVKRNAGDNPVFWNDLYDDVEYGVKLDYTGTVRDKHCAKKVKNIVNKSKDWLEEKLSNVKKKMKRKWKKKCTTTKRIPTCVKKDKLLEKPHNKTAKLPEVVAKERYVRSSDTNENNDTKKSFAALAANMKKVCQEAAKAIQDTKNIKVRESSKENEEASSLMQQLVRMMSELVDIQVQQKSCAKLPPDLHNFLEWLTAPPDDNVQIDSWTPIAYDYEAGRFAKSTEPNYDYPTTISEDTHQDDRTECLGTIRAVQDLIQQYEGMTDEDKSKMTGVKEYLDNQLLYLNNKLNNLYEPNLAKLYVKRDLQRRRRDTGTTVEDQVMKKVITKTIRTDTLKTTNNLITDKSMANEKKSKNKVKRNWRDVYYKAVEDAEKTTTKLPSKPMRFANRTDRY